MVAQSSEPLILAHKVEVQWYTIDAHHHQIADALD